MYVYRSYREKNQKLISCSICSEALCRPSTETSKLTAESSKLILFKDRGGLLWPSCGVLKIVRECEKAFRLCVCGLDCSKPQITSNRHIDVIMATSVRRSLEGENLFPTLNAHDTEHEILFEDLHSTQLGKLVTKNYCKMRALTYGILYHRSVIQQSKIGIRQQSNKLVLFQNL